MFTDSTETVQSRLLQIMEDANKLMLSDAKKRLALIERDYMALLTEQNLFKAIREARDSVSELLRHADNRFHIATYGNGINEVKEEGGGSADEQPTGSGDVEMHEA